MNMRYVLQFGLIICVGFSGCAGVKNSMRPSEKTSQWNPLTKLTDSEKAKKAKKGERPAETMAVIWTDSLMEKPGSTSVRGFGGRIFFYDDQSTAVKSDGELVVYGFDDSSLESKADDSEKNPKADRKYVFKSDQFQSHFSETDLGGSYSVWIPWEQVGGNRKTITLIPVFKTADGRVLKSGQSINVLPGKNPLPEGNQYAKIGDRFKNSSGVAQAGYESSKGSDFNDVANADLDTTETTQRSRIKTSTIQLTPSMAAHLSTPVKQPEIGTSNVNHFENSKIQLPPSPKSSRFPGEHTSSSRNSNESSNSTQSNSTASTSNDSNTSQRVFGSPGSFR